MPHFDFAELRKLERRSEENASQKATFDRPVRRVGERLRRIGAASFVGEMPPGILLGYKRESAFVLAETLAAELRSFGPAEVRETLRLSDYQAGLFVRAVRAFEHDGTVSLDLVELGGDFVAIAKAAWLGPDHRLPFSDADLRLLFRVRFSRLTETLDDELWGPGRTLMLAYYGLLLRYPPAEPSFSVASRLSTIRSIQELDPTYPVDLAEGLVLLRSGQMTAAATLLEHAPSSGPFARLRQNSLLYAHKEGAATF
jgi:hypothetical protein